ncbi:MAG: hypothetical protein AAFY41_10935, partial [Bacteroidota bacterium]
MNRLLPPRVTLFLLGLMLALMSFATAPQMNALVKISDTQVNVYFDQPVQISGTYTSGFTIQDCKGSLFSVQSVSDGLIGDEVLELTVSDISMAFGDLTLTYLNVNDPITDLDGNVFDTDGIGVDNAATLFDVDDIVYENEFFTLNESSQPNAFTFNDDGTRMYVVGLFSNDGFSIIEYDLSIAYAIESAVFTGNTIAIQSQTDNPLDIDINDDGSTLYVLGFFESAIITYDMTTNYDLS